MIEIKRAWVRGCARLDLRVVALMLTSVFLLSACIRAGFYVAHDSEDARRESSSDAVGAGEGGRLRDGDGARDREGGPLGEVGVPDRSIRSEAGAGSYCSRVAGPVLACYDFEDDPLSWKNEEALNAGGTFSTVAGFGGRPGTAALFQVPAERDGWAHLRHVLTPPLSSGELHVRAFVYVPASVVVKNWIIVMQMAGTSSQVSLNVIPNDMLNIANNATSGSVLIDSAKSIASAMPRDRWFCLEFSNHLGESSGTMQIFADDALVAQTGSNDTVPVGGVQELRFGVVLMSSASPATVAIYMDDVVIAQHRIGCK